MRYRIIILSLILGLNKAHAVDVTSASWHAIKHHFSPSSLNTLRMVSLRQDKQHVVHTHFQQFYDGYFVFGGAMTTHSAGGTTRRHGMVYPDLEAQIGKPNALLVFNQSKALRMFLARYDPSLVLAPHVEAIVYVDEHAKAHWAYHVGAKIVSSQKMEQKPQAIIDAATLKPLVTWDDVKTVWHEVDGQGFGGNESSGLHQYGVDRPLLTLGRDAATGECSMMNQNVVVVDMQHQYHGSGQVIAFDCTSEQSMYWTGVAHDGFDRINGAYSPENDALYVGGVIQSMYQQWFGVSPLPQSNSTKPMKMRVHYGVDYENAFWNGSSMTFGDGGAWLHPLVSIGIGAHEISHGFTEKYSDLAYFGQSGGMNEAFSDMAAQASEYFSQGVSSWVIGAEIIKSDGAWRALRYMEHPHWDGHSIEFLEEYQSGMDVHYASGLYNRLFFLLANTPDWNTQKAFQVMVKANMDYWTPYETFSSGACGIMNAANDLHEDLNAVQQALLGVGIDVKACELS